MNELQCLDYYARLMLLEESYGNYGTIDGEMDRWSRQRDAASIINPSFHNGRKPPEDEIASLYNKIRQETRFFKEYQQVKNSYDIVKLKYFNSSPETQGSALGKMEAARDKVEALANRIGVLEDQLLGVSNNSERLVVLDRWNHDVENVNSAIQSADDKITGFWFKVAAVCTLGFGLGFGLLLYKLFSFLFSACSSDHSKKEIDPPAAPADAQVENRSRSSQDRIEPPTLLGSSPDTPAELTSSSPLLS